MDGDSRTNPLGSADCQMELLSSAWVLHDGDAHVTNDASWFAESREFKGQLEDELGHKLAAERIGPVYLQLESGLFVRLNDVLLCPAFKYNMVSQNLIAEDVALCLKGNEGSLMIEQRSNKTTQIDFIKKFGQKKIILTKQPSFESLIEHARAVESTKVQPENLNSCSSNLEVLERQANDVNNDVKLRKADTPWRPFFHLRLPREASPDYLVREARSMLNKITPSNSETIIEKFCELEVTTAEELEELVEILFQKAINEPIYYREHAMLARKMAQKSVQNESDQKTTTFKGLLLIKSQDFFESQRSLEELEVFVERKKEIDNCADEKKKRQLLDELDDEIRFSKKRCLGCVKLIGALFLYNCLNYKIIDLVLDVLFSDANDVSLEYLCALLKTIGKKYESICIRHSLKSKFNQQMSLLEKIVQENQIAPRTKFLIMDVLECRANGWKLRQIEEANEPAKIQSRTST